MAPEEWAYPQALSILLEISAKHLGLATQANTNQGCCPLDPDPCSVQALRGADMGLPDQIPTPQAQDFDSRVSSSTPWPSAGPSLPCPLPLNSQKLQGVGALCLVAQHYKSFLLHGLFLPWPLPKSKHTWLFRE